MDKLYGWLTLRSVRGLGEKSIKKLYEAFKNIERILSADLPELSQVVGKTKAYAILKRKGVDRRGIEKVLEVVEKEDITCFTIEDPLYPEKLRELSDPPPVIFLKGRLKDLPFAGVVGTRNPTSYTELLVEDTVKHLIDEGFGIVSGGAVGVDSKAHETALERGGYTLCVLGYGLMRARYYLLKRIVDKGGGVLSEFLPYEKGDKFTFPKRNRLIAVLSDFIVIPEAGSRSGSLITARVANRYGRGVFVHIGIGRSSNWDGCYELLREGKAAIFKEPEDITGHRSDQVEETIVEREDPLIEFLETPRTFEEILDFTGATEGDLMALLTELELQGKLRRMGAMYIAS
jgi:DNA processing protein